MTTEIGSNTCALLPTNSILRLELFFICLSLTEQYPEVAQEVANNQDFEIEVFSQIHGTFLFSSFICSNSFFACSPAILINANNSLMLSNSSTQRIPRVRM